jgi:cell division septation protein DedD
VERKLTKRVPPVKAAVQEKNIPEIPLPAERLEDHADLFEQVIGWQTTWENMDIEGHLAYYQDSETPSQIRKKRFLARHPEPRLETSSKILLLKEGVPLVFFEQEFSSETMKSRGLKELEWTRTPSGWKIRTEKFYKSSAHAAQEPLANPEDLKARANTEKTIKLSFVIHVSSHANESSTVSLVNRLRENGFDAYWVSVRISKEIQIYRVYVGRFSDWNQAQRVVRILRKKPFGGHATAIPYRFALQVGEANSLIEARMLLESLRKSGLSGLLLVSYGEPAGIHFRVVVGAFKKADNATWILQQLKQSGFSGKLIFP